MTSQTQIDSTFLASLTDLRMKSQELVENSANSVVVLTRLSEDIDIPGDQVQMLQMVAFGGEHDDLVKLTNQLFEFTRGQLGLSRENMITVLDEAQEDEPNLRVTYKKQESDCDYAEICIQYADARYKTPTERDTVEVAA